ncbi:hypothetical protein D3C78_1584340 [compost metagenome]
MAMATLRAIWMTSSPVRAMAAAGVSVSDWRIGPMLSRMVVKTMKPMISMTMKVFNRLKACFILNGLILFLKPLTGSIFSYLGSSGLKVISQPTWAYMTTIAVRTRMKAIGAVVMNRMIAERASSVRVWT